MIAEIVGVAGTGKSTIAKSVTQRCFAVKTNYDLRWRYVLPTYYMRAALAVPRYLVHYRCNGQVFWPTLKWMIYLEKLHRSVTKLGDESQILFDQGPVYWLTYLRAFGSSGIQDEWFTKWWSRALKDWSSTLDVIFCLECDDSILIERIRNRGKKHRIQGLSNQEAREFLTCYRQEYGNVIASLTSSDGPIVYYLSTDRESPEQIVGQILTEFMAKSSC